MKKKLTSFDITGKSTVQYNSMNYFSTQAHPHPPNSVPCWKKLESSTVPSLTGGSTYHHSVSKEQLGNTLQKPQYFTFQKSVLRK